MKFLAVTGKITIMQVRATITKSFKLKQLSTKLRAGSAGAQREAVLGITTHSQHSPKPSKDIKLHGRGGPPHLFQGGPTAKVKKVQNQNPDVEQTSFGKGPQATFGEIWATTTKTVQGRKGQREDCGSRQRRTTLGSKGTGEAEGKLCA